MQPERASREDVEAVIEALIGTELPGGGHVGISRDGGFEGDVGFGQIELERVEGLEEPDE